MTGVNRVEQQVHGETTGINWCGGDSPSGVPIFQSFSMNERLLDFLEDGPFPGFCRLRMLRSKGDEAGIREIDSEIRFEKLALDALFRIVSTVVAPPFTVTGWIKGMIRAEALESRFRKLG